MAMIGILAGMGPRSTALFLTMVLNECQRQYGAKYDIDYPPMMIYSLPTPFYLDRPIDHALMQRTLIAGLRQLESSGAAFIAMPCNSAHIYYPALAASIRIPLLNMIDEAIGALPNDARTMALLATRITAESGLYQSGAARNGIELLGREDWQAMVDSVIGLSKTGPIESARSGWIDLLAHVETAGVDSVLLACTDLNPAASGVAAPVPVLDATECLARATVSRWLEMR